MNIHYIYIYIIQILDYKIYIWNFLRLKVYVFIVYHCIPGRYKYTKLR